MTEQTWRVQWTTPNGTEAARIGPPGHRPRADWLEDIRDSLQHDFGGTWIVDRDYEKRVVTVSRIDPPA